MQKSLEQMKVRVQRAVWDLEGATGLAMVRAMVSGERDARERAQLRDPGCRKSAAEMAEQLSGHGREEHLFSLGQGLKMDETMQTRIADYDREILRKLATLERDECRGQEPPPLRAANKAKAIRKGGEEPMRRAWYRRSGVDLTGMDAVGVKTVEGVLSE
jgi:hypothetical protein